MWPNIVVISNFVPYDISQSFSLSYFSLLHLRLPLLSHLCLLLNTLHIAIFMGEHMVNTNTHI